MPTTTFVWDPVNDCVISELDGTGATQAVYTNEPQQYGGVLSQRRGGTSSFLHADALGTTRLLTSTAGATTDTYLLDAWGNPVSSTGSTVNPFRWVGRYGYYFNTELGAYYVRARLYRPSPSRWVSKDPLALADGVNDFVYAYNNSLLYTDPSGLTGALQLAIVACFLSSGGYDVYKSVAGDKWMHCAASCKMAKVCGLEMAEVAGLAKELGPNNFDEWQKDLPKHLRDSLGDLLANQQCIPWESILSAPVRLIGHLCRREDCEECCDRKVGRHTTVFPPLK